MRPRRGGSLPSWRIVLLLCLLAHPAAAATLQPGDILVANSTSIVQVDPITGAQTSVASGFNLLTGIALEADGNIIVSDNGDSKVYRIDPMFRSMELQARNPVHEVLRLAQTAIAGKPIVLPIAPDETEEIAA